MQNIFISTIKFGAVAMLAFSVFAGEAFASTAFLPSSVSGVSDTSATLISKVVSSGNNRLTVWFEWGETPNPTTVIAMRDIYGEGFFQGHLSDLRTGATYYFRAVAMDGVATTYSPVTAFTTSGGATSAAVTNLVQVSTVSTGVSTQNTNTTNAANIVTAPVSPATPAVSASAPAQKTSNTKNNDAKVDKNTSSMASVGNSSGILPGTLIGWVALLIGLLIIFLIVAMIIDSAEDRRKAREEAKKKKRERDAETE